MPRGEYVVPFSQLRMTDVEAVGGKNASLGEMLSQLSSAGIRVPDGFATTADAFRAFIDGGGLRQRIVDALDRPMSTTSAAATEPRFDLAGGHSISASA
jgi:pyruvate,water dikinase